MDNQDQSQREAQAISHQPKYWQQSATSQQQAVTVLVRGAYSSAKPKPARRLTAAHYDRHMTNRLVGRPAAALGRSPCGSQFFAYDSAGRQPSASQSGSCWSGDSML